MRILKSQPLLNMGNSYVTKTPQPSNISYLGYFGSLIAFCLIIQILTGVNPDVIKNDSSDAWGTFFQDNATPQMGALEELHNNIMFCLAILFISVGWTIISTIIYYNNNKISNKYVNHGTLVELIWTISPGLILILIAIPTFKLLYLMDEVIDPQLVICGEGDAWYWNYEYPDLKKKKKK